MGRGPNAGGGRGRRELVQRGWYQNTKNLYHYAELFLLPISKIFYVFTTTFHFHFLSPITSHQVVEEVEEEAEEEAEEEGLGELHGDDHPGGGGGVLVPMWQKPRKGEGGGEEGLG